ncbi:hypothetical protein B0A55_03762 [Friedmanniomyces simplex]|uniref:aldehyde dehydrogenase (NAD(+)) n=1 Tax=Friedmanniomyces simplex TaxID=329884 RepID=A0A4V5NGG5_9PEZI|nr:hypothetical protein B0A55_03762 [Friedmanniomyces simplex]
MDAYELNSTNNSPSSFAIMCRWIKDCHDNHPLCRQLEPSARSLPTRLIYIGESGASDPIKPVLRLTAGLSAEIKYTTLSHCWGGQKFLRLLVADELAFRENIPVTELSKTFRDAMEVTRRLGICYIWIDSLCIIQDCEEDWRNEAKRMGEVYRGSCCNIAATAAKDGRDGLFRRRTLLEVEPCRIQATWTSSRQEAYFCHNLDIWDIEIDERPLLARAWVTQELNLSRRSLHFGRTQTFWECTQRRACESYPDRIPNFKAAKPSLHPSSLDLDNPFRFYDGRFIAHELWEKIVNLYSHGELTFESKDKLIAVSGLARNLGLPPETYLAGLWRQGLEEQLLWCVLKEGQTTMSTAAGPAVYRAPSWSWASINGPVLVKTPTMLALKHASIEVLDAKTEFVDPSNPFGQVQSGFLRLRCMLARGYLRERIEVMKTNWTFRSKQLAATPFDTSDPDRYQKRQYFGDSHVNVVWDRGEPALDRAYYCMLVNQQFGGCGLVVQPTGRRHGEYERLGYFAILTGAQEDSPARFSELCRKPLEDDHLYESRDSVTEAGIPRYTPFEKRMKAVLAYADEVEKYKQELTTLLTIEQGKPTWQISKEAKSGVHWIRGMASLSLPEDTIEETETKENIVRYTPIRVVGASFPWNFHILLTTGKGAPALRTGNTIIVKPSPFAPYCALKLVELAQKFFPPGVVQSISGGNEMGPMMTEHPGIDKISFTGSAATGKLVKSCSKTLKRVFLELQRWQRPSHHLPGRNIASVAPQVANHAFNNSGQICLNLKGLFIHDSIYDEFLAAVVAYVKTMAIGNGLDEGIMLGPLQNSMQFIDNPPEDSRIVVEEPFGPIVPALSWMTEDEVIARANNTRMGLGASVWTKDLDAADSIARQLEVGSVWFDIHFEISPFVPFGGHKESGVGSEWGMSGLKAHCNVQSIFYPK